MIGFLARAIGNRVALIRDEPRRATVSELDLDDARLLRDQLDAAIRRAEGGCR